MYRAFESWSGEKEWMVTLPAGEEATVVAAGSSVVAVATNKQVGQGRVRSICWQLLPAVSAHITATPAAADCTAAAGVCRSCLLAQLLRLYSLAGRQLSIVALQGPPVALVAAGGWWRHWHTQVGVQPGFRCLVSICSLDAARRVCLLVATIGPSLLTAVHGLLFVVHPGAGGDEVAAACEHQLAVVWAQGPPEPLQNTQQLSYTVRPGQAASLTARRVYPLDKGCM